MNDESARNASRLHMNACVCSHALHGQFAHTLLVREKKVGYFSNRPRIFLSCFAVIYRIMTAKKNLITFCTSLRQIKFDCYNNMLFMYLPIKLFF